MATASTPVDGQIVEDALKQIALPKGIRFSDLTFDKDWSGDDAAYARFAAAANLSDSKGVRSEMRRIVREAKAAMRSLEPDRLTYVYFVAGRS